MGELYFQFEGVCTNFRNFENPWLPVLHRVVLPNVASLISAFGHDVKRHEALCYLGMDNEPGLPLEGVVITVQNAKGSGCTYDQYYDAIPRLGTLMRNAGKE